MVFFAFILVASCVALTGLSWERTMAAKRTSDSLKRKLEQEKQQTDKTTGLLANVSKELDAERSLKVELEAALTDLQVECADLETAKADLLQSLSVAEEVREAEKNEHQVALEERERKHKDWVVQQLFKTNQLTQLAQQLHTACDNVAAQLEYERAVLDQKLAAITIPRCEKVPSTEEIFLDGARKDF